MNQRILASLMVIGVVGAVAAGSTLALFNDTEASTGNTFAAGQVDLKIDWTETYNNQTVELQNATDNPGPVFSLNDVKPGDSGEATISLDVRDNPAWIWMKTNLTSNDDVSSNEPELEVDAPNQANNSWDGELAQTIKVDLWYDDGDNVHEDGEPPVVGDGRCEHVNLDLGLTLDRSGSMSNPSSKIVAAKNGSKILVDSIANDNQGALVSFSSSATLDQELTHNTTLLKQKIDALTTGGTTNMGDGIATAHDELVNGTNARNDSVKVMVLLSDGQPNVGGTAIAEANSAKADGIRIITIGIGNDADMTTLTEIASSEDDSYYAPNSTELVQIFEDISQEVCGVTTLADLTTAMNNGVLLDFDNATNGTQPYPNTGTQYLGFKWTLPRDTGNVVQSDATSFDMKFYTQQSRNNPEPANPWTTS